MCYVTKDTEGRVEPSWEDMRCTTKDTEGRAKPSWEAVHCMLRILGQAESSWEVMWCAPEDTGASRAFVGGHVLHS